MFLIIRKIYLLLYRTHVIIDFHRTRNRCFYADPQANTATSTASSFCSIFEHGVVIKLSNFHTNTGTVCIIGIRFILRNNAIV